MSSFRAGAGKQSKAWREGASPSQNVDFPRETLYLAIIHCKTNFKSITLVLHRTRA